MALRGAFSSAFLTSSDIPAIRGILTSSIMSWRKQLMPHVAMPVAHVDSKPLFILSLQYVEYVYTLPCLTHYSACIALRV